MKGHKKVHIMYHVGSIPKLHCKAQSIKIDISNTKQPLRRTESQSLLINVQKNTSFYNYSYSSDSDTSFRYDDANELEISSNDLEQQIMTNFERETEFTF